MHEETGRSARSSSQRSNGFSLIKFGTLASSYERFSELSMRRVLITKHT